MILIKKEKNCVCAYTHSTTYKLAGIYSTFTYIYVCVYIYKCTIPPLLPSLSKISSDDEETRTLHHHHEALEYFQLTFWRNHLENPTVRRVVLRLTIEELGALGVAFLHLLTLVGSRLHVAVGGGEHGRPRLHQEFTNLNVVTGGGAVEGSPGDEDRRGNSFRPLNHLWFIQWFGSNNQSGINNEEVIFLQRQLPSYIHEK